MSLRIIVRVENHGAVAAGIEGAAAEVWFTSYEVECPNLEYLLTNPPDKHAVSIIAVAQDSIELNPQEG